MSHRLIFLFFFFSPNLASYMEANFRFFCDKPFTGLAELYDEDYWNDDDLYGSYQADSFFNGQYYEIKGQIKARDETFQLGMSHELYLKVKSTCSYDGKIRCDATQIGSCSSWPFYKECRFNTETHLMRPIFRYKSCMYPHVLNIPGTG